MTAARIDGKALAAEILAESAIRVSRLRAAGTVPGLAVVLVGDKRPVTVEMALVPAGWPAVIVG